MNIKETINSPEGRTLEFKRQAPEKLDNLLRTVIAFSNGSGGEILIGVDDNRKLIGIDQDPFELEERLASLIHDRISPVPGVFFVKIFRKAGYIEQLGTGIIRMRESCRDAGLAEPKFEEVGSYFKVTFFKRQNTLSPELKAVYDFLRKQGEQASSQIAAGLDIHQNTVLKRLKKLMDADLVVKKGKGADVRYEVRV